MIVWLWNADGPAGNGRGVTDDRARAFQSAEACLCSGQADVAEVEGARLVLGVRTLAFEYERTGEGWRPPAHASVSPGNVRRVCGGDRVAGSVG